MKGKINVSINMDVLVNTKDFPECNGVSGIAEYAEKSFIEDFKDDTNVENIQCKAKVLEITENE